MSRRTQGDRDHRQRLLDRFIKTGLAGFADYEILELILMLAIPQGDVIEPARELIAKYKDLRGILDAPIEELRAISGIASAMPGRSPNRSGCRDGVFARMRRGAALSAGRGKPLEVLAHAHRRIEIRSF